MDLATNLPLSSKSNAPVETQDATLFAEPPTIAAPLTIAAPKSSAQRQREYRQRIAASRTHAQAIAKRMSDTERKRKYRLRKAANMALTSSPLESTTASSSHSAGSSNDPVNMQDAASSTSATPLAESPTIAAPKSNAQRQREYKQRMAASRTPAQWIAKRMLDTERKRKYRLRKAANLALASGSLESTTASWSNYVQNSTQQALISQLTYQQHQYIAADSAQTTVQPAPFRRNMEPDITIIELKQEVQDEPEESQDEPDTSQDEQIIVKKDGTGSSISKESINVDIKPELNLNDTENSLTINGNNQCNTYKLIEVKIEKSPTVSDDENCEIEINYEISQTEIKVEESQMEINDENSKIGATLEKSTVSDLVDSKIRVKTEPLEPEPIKNDVTIKIAKLKRKNPLPVMAKKVKKLKVIDSNSKDNDEPEETLKDDQGQKSVEMSNENKEYYLKVTNLPTSWGYMEIKNYIDTECGPVDEMEMLMDNKTGKGAIKLSFPNEQECRNAMNKLQEKDVAGNKLVLEMSVETESDSEEQSDNTEDSSKPWRPDLDPWDVDVQGTYGLKLPFLRSLGITPPLDKWVLVSNFRCDKLELRDIMSLAGNVLICSMYTVANRYANVMYSHPLEAVQAISMLNNQPFYGQKLKVTMNRSPNETILLPKGLSRVGKGLGTNGKPLRNIVKHYERFVENKDCLISPAYFDIPENHSMKISSSSSTFTFKSLDDFLPVSQAKDGSASSNVSKAKPSPHVSNKPATPQMIQITKRDVQPVSNRPVTPLRGNFQRAPFAPPQYRPAPMMNPTPGPMVSPGPMPGQMRPGFPQPQPFTAPRPGWTAPGPMFPNPNEPVKLMLSNLPPSTTFALLCTKMSEWGHVLCIQLTTPGCAVVTFANRMQADNCFKFYNGRNIDNYFVQVTYSM